MKKILVVCAHPDDETLGMGGTIAIHSKNNDKIFVLIVSDGESARDSTKIRINERKKQAELAGKILGIHKIKFLNYPDQQLDIISISELSKKISNEILLWKPDIVYTHFWNDINQDHRQVFEATSIAVRPLPKSKISEFIVFETPSSSEWGSKGSQFNPNYFIEIDTEINIKLKAFKKYKHEVMKYPHPRSLKSIKNRATYWGNSIGKNYVEAFMIVRKII